MAPRASGRLCYLCFESFTVTAESFLPLSLHCGHSLCSRCWNELTKSPTNPSCPFCMQESGYTIGKNYSLIELLTEVGEDEEKRKKKEEEKEDRNCEICGEMEQRVICCDCQKGCQRQCESCSVHLHQLDRLSFHRRSEILDHRKEDQEEGKNEGKEDEKEEEKQEEEKQEEKREGKGGNLSKQKPKRRKSTKEVSKKGCNQLSPIATKVVSLLNERKHLSAFLLSSHHAWSDGDCAALLAICFLDGVGTKISDSSCRKWAQYSVESGSWFGRGIQLYVQGTRSYDQVKPILLPFAEKGISIAQRCIGRCCEQLGERNLGYQYYCKGSEQGLASATNNMAGNLLNGIGVEKDTVRGLKIMTELADGIGWPQSQKNIAYYHKSGANGMEVDYKKAVSYIRLAVAQGQLNAVGMLADCYLHGHGVPQSDFLAFYHYKLASESGLVVGTSNLGFCYANGVGVEKDDGMAIYYYMIAAEKGSLYSQKKLGNRYENGGEGVAPNKEQALLYYQLAAKQGDKEAKEAVARLEPNVKKSERK